ncbi:MAG TPA: chitinase [Streptosporangiaceae bacterium]|nr:chitinase [Streptosporangiaceae bacterium]
MRPVHRLALAASLAGTLVAAAAVAPAWAAASEGAAGYRALPRHIYAPYFETYLPGMISPLAQSSGARYFTLAFIQTPKKGSCTPTWDGSAKAPISAGKYLPDIAKLRAMGGDVIPSFGGYSADQGGTEIADSCTSVAKIAQAYEQVVTTYHVTRLDMDVEANSLNNSAGIARRDAAIAMAQKWAASQGINLQVTFTLPVEPYGLDTNEVPVLADAVKDGVNITAVNIMIFDYYLPHEGIVDMTAYGEAAAINLHNQLATLLPKDGPSQLWQLEAMTLLPGIDDHPAQQEVTSLQDFRTLLKFAQSNDMKALSIWAIQRDNGGCPGATDSNTCSGVVQKRWAFSRILEQFAYPPSSKHTS